MTEEVRSSNAEWWSVREQSVIVRSQMQHA